jgi:hypothetical protein
MGDNKLIAVRFDKNLYNKIEKQSMSNSELIRKAVADFLQENTKKTTIEDDFNITDELYNNVYNNMYNYEVSPLKNEIKHLKDKIGVMQTAILDLKEDKVFLQNQMHALTVLNVAKTPLLSRIKMKLLKQNNE